MLQFTKLFDLSVPLGEETVIYPDDLPYTREENYSSNGGDPIKLSSITMSAHSGTHIDLPAHFFSDNKTIESYPPEEFILPAQVVEIDNPRLVEKDELSTKEIGTGLALLFKTANSRQGLLCAGRFTENYVSLSPAAALYCVEKRARLVGLDYLSVDRYGDQNYPIHHILLKNGIIVLECINLVEVPEGEYTLICLPLKLKGAEASPVRAVLLK
jgi:arylformamidase